MITESEKRAVLLAEYLQMKAEEDYLLSQRKKAIKRTQSLIMEAIENERDRSEIDD